VLLSVLGGERKKKEGKITMPPPEQSQKIGLRSVLAFIPESRLVKK
jgi:hypothetical protein